MAGEELEVQVYTHQGTISVSLKINQWSEGIKKKNYIYTNNSVVLARGVRVGVEASRGGKKMGTDRDCFRRRAHQQSADVLLSCTHETCTVLSYQ